MNNKSAWLMMAGAALAMSGGNMPMGERRTRLSDIDFEPKKEPIPKGCKEYFFDEDGDFDNEVYSGVIFTCIALNKANAIKKFNNFLKSRNGGTDTM